MSQETSKSNDSSSSSPLSSLSFSFRGKLVPVTHGANVTAHEAALALQSEPFVNWYRRCEQSSSSSSSFSSFSLHPDSSDNHLPTKKRTNRIDIQSVEIQSVDLFGARYVYMLSTVLCERCNAGHCRPFSLLTSRILLLLLLLLSLSLHLCHHQPFVSFIHSLFHSFISHLLQWRWVC